MFNGSIPIVLDSLKQHYFIDRDGKMFRHVLNFLRTNHLCVPDGFEEIDLLLEEARFYDIPAMVKSLENLRRERGGNGNSGSSSSHRKNRSGHVGSSASGGGSGSTGCNGGNNNNNAAASSTSGLFLDRNGHELDRGSDDSVPEHGYQILALNISPDLGERIMVSGERALVEEIFSEIAQALMDARSGVAWNMSDARHVIRFPLNGYCKLNSLQTIKRLLNHGFKIVASSGGGVEGQQFSEYLFCRRYIPMQ